MIRVDNNLLILEDIQQVLIKLREAVYKEKNILYFQKFKRIGGSLQTTCPFHGHGAEKHPSCGFRSSDGKSHCFACGAIFTLPETVSHCFGKLDDGKFGERWLIENCDIARIEERIIEPLPIRDKIHKKVEYLSEEELKKYRVYHDYMFTRGLTEELIEQFDVGFDPHFKLQRENGTWSKEIPCLTFPVRDKTGGTLFIARRSIEGKLFHYPLNVQKPIYGLYELYRDSWIGEIDSKFHTLKELVICESIINAITCWKYGIPSVAFIGTGKMEQYRAIRRLPVETIYLGFDADEAGDNATKRFLKNVNRTGIKILDIPQDKDINDLSYDKFWSLDRLSPESWKEKYFSLNQ